MHAWQFSKSLYTSRQHGWTEFVSMQNHLNLLYREKEREMLPLCVDQKIAVIPWSPLARGRLTREANAITPRTETDDVGTKLYAHVAEADARVIDKVGEVARARGVPRAQVALAWVRQKRGVVSPIIGASKSEHLTDALAALSLTLSDEEIKSLEDTYVPHAVAGVL